MRTEHFDIHIEDGLSECHGCGGVMPGHLSIEMFHLCQHFVNLCRRCLKELNEAIAEYEGEKP